MPSNETNVSTQLSWSDAAKALEGYDQVDWRFARRPGEKPFGVTVYAQGEARLFCRADFDHPVGGCWLSHDINAILPPEAERLENKGECP